MKENTKGLMENEIDLEDLDAVTGGVDISNIQQQETEGLKDDIVNGIVKLLTT